MQDKAVLDKKKRFHILLEKGEFYEAELIVTDLEKAGTYNVFTILGRGKILRKKGELHKALLLFKKATKKYPK